MNTSPPHAPPPRNEATERRNVLLQLMIYVFPMVMVGAIPLGMVLYPLLAVSLKSVPAQRGAVVRRCEKKGEALEANEMACLVLGAKMVSHDQFTCPPEYPFLMGQAREGKDLNRRCFDRLGSGAKVGFVPLNEWGQPRPAGLEGLTVR